MDIKKMQELAGINPSTGKQKLDENCAGAFAAPAMGMGEESKKEFKKRQDDFNQEIDYDKDMTEGGCQSPYDDGYGQYGDKCLVGDGAEPVIVAEPEMSVVPEVPVADNNGQDEVIIIDLGEDDDMEPEYDAPEEEPADDAMVDIEDYYGQGGDDGDYDSIVKDIPNIDDRYMDHTIDPDAMIQKIEAMQQGGMSSAPAHYDIEQLYNLPTSRLTNIYKKVMGEEVEIEEGEIDEGPLMKMAASKMATKSIGEEEDMVVDPDGIDDEDDEFTGDEFELGQGEGDLGFGDDEVEMDIDLGYDDPTDEIPDAKYRSDMLDTSSMIAKIMTMQDSGMSSAKAEYGTDSLINMSPDMLLRVYKKVMGETVEEEDANWGGEDGYQAMNDNDTTGHMRGNSPYNGGEGFPTGQADNTVKHIGNTGGDFKDNPLRNADPIEVEESSPFPKRRYHDDEDYSYDSQKDAKMDYEDDDEDYADAEDNLDESLESINASLNESFKEFCESYEAMLEQELDEYGNMSFSTRPSMRSRGYGLSRVGGRKLDKAKSGGPDRAESPKKEFGKEQSYSDFEKELEAEFGELPAILKTQAEDVDPTTKDYMSAQSPSAHGYGDPEIDHNYNDDDIEDLPRGDVSIDDLDASGELGMYMSGGPDIDVDGDAMGYDIEDPMTKLGPNADMTDILQLMRDLESKKNKGFADRDEEMEEGGHFTNRKRADAFDREREARHAERRKERGAMTAATPKPEFKKRDK